LLLALFVFHGDRILSRVLAPGDSARLGDESAGGGGGKRVTYITLPSIPRPVSPPRVEVTIPVPPPKVEIPAPEPVQPQPTAVQPVDTVAKSPVASDAEGASGGAGRGADGGAGEGAQGPGGHAGTGGGTGAGGEGGTSRPPEPRDMAFPFDTPPKELRGVSLRVTFWVRVDGRVERYEVEPEIKDREYAKKFDEVMRAFRFTPARAADGTRVAGTTRISFTLPGKSSS
jgi:hypothetical protein